MHSIAAIPGAVDNIFSRRRSEWNTAGLSGTVRRRLVAKPSHPNDGTCGAGDIGSATGSCLAVPSKNKPTPDSAGDGV